MPPAQRPVLVLAALEVEAAALARRLTPPERTAPGLRIWEGDIDGGPVVLVLTGVGKVAAAMATQFACDFYSPRCIVTIGLAGGADSDAAPGRVIVASGAVQHDVDARPLTVARGVIPGFEVSVWPADSRVAAALMQAAERVVETPGLVRFGVVLTGDQIIASRDFKDRALADFPDGTCFDMETAAVAQVACANGVAWGGVRITSDAADESFNVNEVLAFGAGTAAGLLDRIIREFLP